jgi:paraquat-inducible protein B
MMAKKKAEEFAIDTTPRRVQEKEIDITNELPCGNKITSLIEYLLTAVAKYGDDATVHIGQSYDGYDSYLEATITPYRDETEKEIEKRIAKAKKDKERAMVQRIKEKEKETERKLREEKEELDLLQKLQKKYKGYNIQEVNKGG